MKFHLAILLFTIISNFVFSLPLGDVPKIEKRVIGFSLGRLNPDIDYSAINTLISYKYSTNGKGYISSDAPVTNTEFIKKNGIKNIAMVTNGFDINVSRELLSNGINRKNFIENLKFNLGFDNFDGVNIDFEGISSSEKYLFSSFIKEVYEALNPLGYEVSVDVAARTSDNSNCWGEPYIYSDIGKYCDYLIIMAYDEHYSKGASGPIASYKWVKDVISYAQSVVAPEKIILGLPAYGYDWSVSTAKAYSLDKINSFLSTMLVTESSYDTTSLSPYIKYIDSNLVSHTVWYENNESIATKASLVNEYFLGGVAIWRLGLEHNEYLSSVMSAVNLPDIDTTYLVTNLPTKLTLKKYKNIFRKYARISHIPPYLYGKEKKEVLIGELFISDSWKISLSADKTYNALTTSTLALNCLEFKGAIKKTDPIEYLYAVNAIKSNINKAKNYYSKLDSSFYKN